MNSRVWGKKEEEEDTNVYPYPFINIDPDPYPSDKIIIDQCGSLLGKLNFT